MMDDKENKTPDEVRDEDEESFLIRADMLMSDMKKDDVVEDILKDIDSIRGYEIKKELSPDSTDALKISQSMEPQEITKIQEEPDISKLPQEDYNMQEFSEKSNDQENQEKSKVDDVTEIVELPQTKKVHPTEKIVSDSGNVREVAGLRGAYQVKENIPLVNESDVMQTQTPIEPPEATILDGEPPIPKSAKNSIATEVYEWAESCVFAVAVILLVFVLVLRSATVSGSSMVPTLHDGERLILQQMAYNDPQYGDVIVVDRTQSMEPPIIKRVIGRAGDKIDIDFEAGDVFRNGEKLDEPYINEQTVTEYDVAFPITVPEGCIFVMGDNRNHSADSRTQDIGMIDLHRVMGKAVFRFFPFDKIGVLH